MDDRVRVKGEVSNGAYVTSPLSLVELLLCYTEVPGP